MRSRRGGRTSHIRGVLIPGAEDGALFIASVPIHSAQCGPDLVRLHAPAFLSQGDGSPGRVGVAALLQQMQHEITGGEDAQTSEEGEAR